MPLPLTSNIFNLKSTRPGSRFASRFYKMCIHNIGITQHTPSPRGLAIGFSMACHFHDRLTIDVHCQHTERDAQGWLQKWPPSCG